MMIQNKTNQDHHNKSGLVIGVQIQEGSKQAKRQAIKWIHIHTQKLLNKEINSKRTNRTAKPNQAQLSQISEEKRTNEQTNESTHRPTNQTKKHAEKDSNEKSNSTSATSASRISFKRAVVVGVLGLMINFQ